MHVASICWDASILQEPALKPGGSPDVGQHQHQRADDGDLEDLPVTAQVGHDGHQQLAGQHQEAGHHVHGEPPLWQADLDPWWGRGKDTGKMTTCDET